MNKILPSPYINVNKSEKLFSVCIIMEQFPLQSHRIIANKLISLFVWHAQKHQECYYAHASFAAKSGYSVRTVQRVFNKLLSLGLLTWKSEFMQTNKYYVSSTVFKYAHLLKKIFSSLWNIDALQTMIQSLNIKLGRPLKNSYYLNTVTVDTTVAVLPLFSSLKNKKDSEMKPNSLIYSPELKEIAKILQMPTYKAQRLVHFPSKAHAYALEQIKQGIKSDPFMLCQNYCHQNNIAIDWDIYHAIKSRYSSQETNKQGVLPKAGQARAYSSIKQSYSIQEQRSHECWVNGEEKRIREATLKLEASMKREQEDPAYAARVAQFAQFMPDFSSQD